MKNINALRQRKIDLTAAANNLLASPETMKASRRSLTVIKAELSQVEADIAEVTDQLLRETNPHALLAGQQTRTNTSTKTSVYAKLSDQLLASGLRPTQRADSMAPFASLEEQLRSVYNAGRGMIVDERLGEIQASLGANESVPAEGGFLVVPEFAADLLKRTYDVSQLAGRCYKMPMQTNRLIMHAVDEDSRVDGSRWGGLQAFWLAEGGTYTPTKPKFREMQFVANKLISLSYATEEQLSDGPAWQSYIEETVPMELAFAIDVAIFSGAGAGQPLGFQNSGAVIVVPKESGQSAATIVTNNILNMWSRCWSRSRPNAVWLINQDIEPQLFPLTLGSPSLAQILLFVPPGIMGNNSPYGSMLGRPVIPVEQASTLGTQGDISLVDLNQYTLTEKTPGMRADTSIHVAFLTGEQAFRFMVRLDGQPNWKKPITPYKGSATKSPFVTLAAR